ncbi:MAG: class I SAM-dependent methyltransferase family protein, partial [Deltaproteobacteria bacterium]
RSIKKIQKEAIAKQIAGSRGKPLFIADLASGKADYIYDALVESGNKAANVRALLRDINEETLAESKSIAERLNLSGKVRFERADALDVESLRRLAPRPNLVIEVGLYGIIHDDGLIRAHLRHLRQTVKPDALLFNVQNYNPQIELIARALVNSKGERCVWHLRPLEDLIKWAAEAGFCDPEITQDPYGIYSVVLIKSSDYRGADNRNAS